jgi:hypothetical protein
MQEHHLDKRWLGDKAPKNEKLVLHEFINKNAPIQN